MTGEQHGPVPGEERAAMREDDLPFALWDLFPHASDEDAALLQEQFAGLWAMARLLEASPDDLQARLERARLLIRFGRTEQARADLLAVRRHAPTDPRPVELLVGIALQDRDFAAADTWVDGLLTLRPVQWWGHSLRLLVAERSGVYRPQEDLSADRLADLLPDDPDTWHLVALADLARGRPDRARRMLRRTVAAQPDDTSAAAALLDLEPRPRLSSIGCAAQVAVTHPDAPARAAAKRTLRLLLLGLTGEVLLGTVPLWIVLLCGAAAHRDSASVALLVAVTVIVVWCRRRGRRIRRPFRVLDQAARVAPVLFSTLVLATSGLLLGLLVAFVAAGSR